VRKRLYEERNSNLKKNVRVMDLFFFFLSPFLKMIVVHFNLMYNIVIHILVYCIYLNLI